MFAQFLQKNYTRNSQYQQKIEQQPNKANGTENNKSYMKTQKSQ